MKHITRWSLDTCGCVIDYEWDDVQSEDMRVHKLSNVVMKCAAHSKYNGSKLYDVLVAENTHKNKTIGKIIEMFPNEFPVDADGNIYNLHKINFKYDDNRRLNIAVLGFDNIKKEKLLSMLGKEITIS